MTALFALAFESGILTAGFLSLNAEQDYVIHLLCIFFGIGGTFGCLKLFRLKKVRAQLTQEDNLSAALSLQKWNIVRTLCMAVNIAVPLVVYYGTLGTSPLYCLLIALTGHIFCWPKTGEA